MNVPWKLAQSLLMGRINPQQVPEKMLYFLSQGYFDALKKVPAYYWTGDWQQDLC